jgi:hypothetical protein
LSYYFIDYKDQALPPHSPVASSTEIQPFCSPGIGS